MNKNLAIVAAIILVIGIAAGILVITNNNKKDKEDDSNITSTSTTTNNTSNTSTNTTTETDTSNTSTGIAAFDYVDGTYEADGSYTSPAGTESIGVSLTVEKDIVTAVTLTSKAKDSQSKSYQNLFIKGISGAVVGKKLDGLTVGKVNGSSLTGSGFNKAVKIIQTEATN